MEEQALPGGYVTEVVRVGDTVRRTPPPDPAFVHALLGLFERRGWPGAPRFLGHDEQGRDVLTFMRRPCRLGAGAARRGDLAGQPGPGGASWCGSSTT